MFKIDLEVGIDSVKYHIYDGRMINYSDTVQHEPGESIAKTAVIATQAAMAYYFAAAARISSDGP